MQVENPVAGQRCINIHATLDTSILEPATSRYSGGAEHLSNMMVFHKPDNNSRAKHTSISNRRHGAGMATKAVANLHLVKQSELPNLKFMGVTRDHLLNGEDALHHPASAGMFAVTIDGVVTIRAPWYGDNDTDKKGELAALKPGDFLGISDKTKKKINADGDIETFSLCKLLMKRATPNQTIGAERVKNPEETLWNEFPIGRLVEWRAVAGQPDGVYDFRVNLCPFGAPFELLDSGLRKNKPESLNTQNMTGTFATKGTEIKNGPETYGLTLFDMAPIQPTQAQAQHPPEAATLGHSEAQTAMGSSMSAAPFTGTYSGIAQWETSAHFSEMTPEAQSALRAAAHPDADGGVYHVVHSDEGTSVQRIEDAAKFRKHVLDKYNDQYEIQTGPNKSAVSVYVTKQASAASSMQIDSGGPASPTKAPTKRRTTSSKTSGAEKRAKRLGGN